MPQTWLGQHLHSLREGQSRVNFWVCVLVAVPVAMRLPAPHVSALAAALLRAPALVVRNMLTFAL